MKKLKGNQGELHKDVRAFCPTKYASEVFQSVDGGHGRIKTRQLHASSEIDWLRERHPERVGLNSILAVTSHREQHDKTETRYFISSLKADNPKRLARAVRAHWGIENQLHWVLDVGF
ncbi:ISAs1 family transposase [methane-oxidizing endosymbiont of Gigantopelta aegis]|uniref:ISAs1 family transposase n=1 Tax=methane-oxidizing endosymbiont of Gigantopelta aegis TaxID=2794938 RepID=UPI0018DCB9A2|nr:ISAs1 family transposase [methane-oxidizing endosymbiont of Gigantopelta aegis]